MVPRPLFGGNVGRKSRADGLKPGSPEAVAADRTRETERKRAQRATQRATTPPPPLPPSPSAPSPTADSLAPAPGVVAADFGGAGVPVPWQADSLKPLFEQLIEAAEESRVSSFLGKCKEAGLLGKLLKEIEADARFPKAAKLLLCRSLPRLAAKWLNMSGISAEYEDEVECVSAMILIVSNDRKLSARLDQVIAEIKKPAEQAKI